MVNNSKKFLLILVMVFSNSMYCADLKVEAERNFEKRKEIDFFAPDCQFPSNSLKHLQKFLYLLVRFIDHGQPSPTGVMTKGVSILYKDIYAEFYNKDYDFIKDLKNFLTASEIEELLKDGNEYLLKKADLEYDLDKYTWTPKYDNYYSALSELASPWYKKCFKLIDLYKTLCEQARTKFSKFDEYLREHKELIQLNLPYSG